MLDNNFHPFIPYFCTYYYVYDVFSNNKSVKT